MKRKDTSSSSKEPHDESAWKRLNYVPGGARQKTKWASEIANKGAKPSALAEFLISQWSWGHISTPFMQKVAEAAAADGLQHPEIERLSSLGSHGRHPNNAHRDLMTHLVKPPIHEAIGNITLLQKYNLSFVSTSQSILLPHELFASMYANHRDKFFHYCVVDRKTTLVPFGQACANIHPISIQHCRREKTTRSTPYHWQSMETVSSSMVSASLGAKVWTCIPGAAYSARHQLQCRTS